MQQSPQTYLSANNLSKKFNSKKIFSNVSFELKPGGSIAITGRNGSGKSTLVKIIAGLLGKTAGEVILTIDNERIKSDFIHIHTGFVSPYLNLYDEFTGYENLKITADIRGTGHNNISDALKRVGLYDRRNDLLKIYSSGMKQRLKLAFGILHSPLLLILDEPTSNLDAEGVKIVDGIAEEYKRDRMLIIATNDEHERLLCKDNFNIET